MSGTFEPSDLHAKKLAGYTVTVHLNSDDECHWYEARADNGDLAILYVYFTQASRDQARPKIHGFRTSVDEILSEPFIQRIYVTVGSHRLMMPIALRLALTDKVTRPVTIEGYSVERVLGFGFKGITYEVKRNNGPGTPYALKLTIGEEYDHKTVLPEVDRMVDVAKRDRDHFPQIHSFGAYTFSAGAHNSRLVYFVEDFIAGQTLESVLKTKPDSLTPIFLNDFVGEMLAAIATLQTCGLMHDDLHAGNVMLHAPLNGRRRPCLIDFGSAKPRGTTKKPRDDIRNLASQIAQILNAVQQHQLTRTPFEARIIAACESLLATISDDDPMRRPEDAKQLHEQFEQSFVHGSVQQALVHPFDFGNAEEVLDNSLLYSLAAKSFPWRDRIEESSHLLVIGPRGCGKTTVFRSMSFRCLADAGQINEALQRSYLGLYISCNKEFRQRFSAIDRQLLMVRQDDIRHYFHLIVLRELTGALAACHDAGMPIAIDLNSLSSFLQRNFPALLGAVPLSSASDLEARVTKAIQDTRMAIWNGTPIVGRTNQGFVADLADLVALHLLSFSGKTLFLFIDDYTEGKIPKEAQQAINHILFVPNSQYKCKISSEVFGVTHDEIFDTFLEKDRDYKEWNLGTEYCLNLPSKVQTAFLKEIVNTRLALCSYNGTVETLIGGSVYANGTLERTLRGEAAVRKERRQASAGLKPPSVIDREIEQGLVEAGVPAHYHGWDTICNLCTGDVSNILELLNRMFELCAIKKDTCRLIPPEHQGAVIEEYALQYVNKIKGIPGCGEQMFSIVNAFGNMARRLLEEHPLVGQRQEPYRLLRIELDEATRFLTVTNRSDAESETDAALQLWKRLQRYCIFIDADESRSRRNTLSSRALFRRIFCPAFRIGLVNSECWTLSKQHWEAFCNDPTGRAEQYARTSIESAQRRRGDERLLPFPDLDESKE